MRSIHSVTYESVGMSLIIMARTRQVNPCCFSCPDCLLGGPRVAYQVDPGVATQFQNKRVGYLGFTPIIPYRIQIRNQANSTQVISVQGVTSK